MVTGRGRTKIRVCKKKESEDWRKVVEKAKVTKGWIAIKQEEDEGIVTWNSY